MLLKEIFYKRKNKKAWSLRLLPLVFLSCFVLSVQSFASSAFSPSELHTLIWSRSQPILKYLAANVLSRSEEHYSKDFSYNSSMKNIILHANDETLLYIAKKVSFDPSKESDANLVKALVESGDTEATRREIVKYIRDHTQENYRGLERGIVRDRDVSIVMEVLSRRHWLKPITLESIKPILENINQAIKRDRDVSAEIVEKRDRDASTEIDRETLKEIVEEVLSERQERESVNQAIEGERQREREVLMARVENTISSPDDAAGLVRDLIEKAGYISPSQMKKVTDSISENYEPSHKHKHEALERFMHVDVLMKIADILSQPGWELHPNLLKVLIAKAGPRILNKIATDVLSQPHWLGRNPHFVAALIAKGDFWVLETVAKDILSQRQWYGNPELIEALIEKGYGDNSLYVLRGGKNYQLLGLINEYILSQRHWRTHPRLIEMLKGEKVTMTNMKGFWERVREGICS